MANQELIEIQVIEIEESHRNSYFKFIVKIFSTLIIVSLAYIIPAMVLYFIWVIGLLNIYTFCVGYLVLGFLIFIISIQNRKRKLRRDL